MNVKLFWSILFYQLLLFTNVSCQNNNTNPKSVQSQNINVEGLSNQSHPDPFLGTFNGKVHGIDLILVVSKTDNELYNIYNNGQGPDQAKLIDGTLQGISANQNFRVEVSNDGLLLNINNQTIAFKNASGNLTNIKQNLSDASNLDPFIGVFKGYIDNNPVTIELISYSAVEYNFYLNGQGPEKIKKIGNKIMMQGAGVEFSIELHASGLLLKGNGKEFILKRVDVLNNSNNYQEKHSEDDPFSGNYDMLANGQFLGKINLKNTVGNNYRFSSAQGEDIMYRKGDQLVGTSSGTPFSIKLNGSNLILNLQSYDFLLTNRQADLHNQAPSVNGQLDQRLVGTWSGSTARSGSSSQQIYRFYPDGRLEYQYSYSAGGNGWSGGKTSDPVETGMYSVANLNANGGILIINGQQSAYEFSNFGGEDKLIIGNKIFKRVY